MITLSFIIIVAFFLRVFILLLTLLTREKTNKEREKITPFECGFSPIKKSRAPFSLRFFMITLIFLIFDIEVSLVLPMGLITEVTSIISWSFTVWVVILILVVGLLHEWKNGVLIWV